MVLGKKQISAAMGFVAQRMATAFTPIMLGDAEPVGLSPILGGGWYPASCTNCAIV